MKLPQTFLILVVSAVVAFVTATYIADHHETGGAASHEESAYDRVLRTGILRCGYADWPPYVFTKNPETGKVAGIFADVTESIAAKLNLKVDWAENTGWGSFIESLRDHKIDAFCAGIWRNATRGRYIAYGRPIFYSAVYPYVAVNDHRFDKDLSAINSPRVRISAIDGEMSDIIAKRYFPNAVEVSVPQLGQITDIMVNVATHKADVVFEDPSLAEGYMKANPGLLRQAQDQPFQTFPTSLVMDIHETQLQEMLDSALVELQGQGVIDQIIAKYSADPKVFLRVAPPYSQP